MRLRWPEGSACAGCGATNPIVLLRHQANTICYGCRVAHAREGDHTGSHGRGPVNSLLPNVHRVRSEVERIQRLVILPGVRTETACGIVTSVAIRLTRLGTLGTAG